MSQYHCKYDELVDPETLTDNPRNPNGHPERQIDALVAFIRDSGWRHPIIVSRRSGYIVCGHARKQAAIRRGDHAPVVYQDFESDSSEQALMLADNHLPELAEMNIELEQIQIRELAEINLPILEWGFEINEQEPHKIEHFDSKPYEYVDIIMRAKIDVVTAETFDDVSKFAKEHCLEVIFAGKD
jgi:ParB-like chromosome segregation protein Spo0J